MIRLNHSSQSIMISWTTVRKPRLGPRAGEVDFGYHALASFFIVVASSTLLSNSWIHFFIRIIVCCVVHAVVFICALRRQAVRASEHWLKFRRKECELCGESKRKMKKCACRMVWYCCEDHQREDQRSHQEACMWMARRDGRM